MTSDDERSVCMRCGSERTLEGLIHHPRGQQMFFVASNQTLLEEFLGRQQRLLLARACADCGHVEIFLRTDTGMTLDDYEDAIESAMRGDTGSEAERPE